MKKPRFTVMYLGIRAAISFPALWGYLGQQWSRRTVFVKWLNSRDRVLKDSWENSGVDIGKWDQGTSRSISRSIAITLHQHVECCERIPDNLTTQELVMKSILHSICTDLAKYTLTCSRNQVAKYSNQEVRHREAEYLASNNIIGFRGISLQVRCIRDKSTATSKSQEEELEDHPRLFRTVDGGRFGYSLTDTVGQDQCPSHKCDSSRVIDANFDVN